MINFRMTRIILFCITFLFICSCIVESLDDEFQQIIDLSSYNDSKIFEAFVAPNDSLIENNVRNDTVSTPSRHNPQIKDTIIDVNQRFKQVYWREGDIILPTLRNVDPFGRKWHKTKYGKHRGLVQIPYTISREYNWLHRKYIKEAFSTFAKLTCIRFVPKTFSGSHINIYNGRGCSSYVGRYGYYGQRVSLSIHGCLGRGTILHELMHVLGFAHEHNRSDRDKYVRINKSHIKKGMEGSFSRARTKNLVVYDYGSVMHYNRLAFATYPWFRSIEILQGGKDKPRIGQRRRLSPYDIEEVKYLYNCQPGTYQRCGKDFFYKKDGTFESPSYPRPYPKEAHCTWKIIVGRGRYVKITFEDINIYESPFCQNDALLVHDGGNAGAPVLRRICGTKAREEVVSSGSSMFIMFSSYTLRTTHRGFTAYFTETSAPGKRPVVKKSPKYTLLPTDHTIDSFWCDFEDGMCGMYQEKNDEADWTLKKGPGPSRLTGPTADHTTGKGHYLLAHADVTPLTLGDIGIVRSPWFKRHKRFCIWFSYHMYGEYMGSLRLYAFEQRYGSRQREVILFQRNKNQGRRWFTSKVFFTPSWNAKFVHFYWKSYRFDWDSDIALDDISISVSGCTRRRSKVKQRVRSSTPRPYTEPTSKALLTTTRPPVTTTKKTTRPPVTTTKKTTTTTSATVPSTVVTNVQTLHAGMHLCTFENVRRNPRRSNKRPLIPGDSSLDLGEYIQEPSRDTPFCGWEQLSSRFDQFDWTRNKGQTKTKGTGPRADHTTYGGYYVYVEASRPRKRNDVACLKSYSMLPMKYCVNLYYHMYGRSIGKLSLNSIETFKNGRKKDSTLRTLVGQQRGIWKHLEVDYFPRYNPSKVEFRLDGIIGGSSRGDIALDDIAIIPGYCNACQRPNYRLTINSEHVHSFATGCAKPDLFWVRCCSHRRVKVVYRHVKQCSWRMFDSTRLLWYCTHL